MSPRQRLVETQRLGERNMRALLITFAIVVVVGAAVLVGLSVRWQDSAPRETLGPSEAQQNRAEDYAVRKSTPPQQLNEAQLRRYQERLDAEGFPTGSEKGAFTLQTEAALRAYQAKYGLPVTGELDDATQRSLVAGQTPTPGRPTEGESIPGGTAPGGGPRE
jgi:peptidoglycan hydrolase-like protein with peptidoglycan-binding domain